MSLHRGLMVALLIISGCGGNKSKVEPAQSFDADANTNLHFALFDRGLLAGEVENATDHLNGYYLQLSPVDAGCPNASQVADSGAFPEDAVIGAQVHPGCDYAVVVAAGRVEVLKPDPGDGPSQAANYQDDIKPLADIACTSCHGPGGQKADADFTTYEGLKAFGADAVKRVGEGSMPPSGTLSDTVKQTFFDWQASGFPRDATGASLTSGFGQLAAVYYASEPGFVVTSAELAAGPVSFAPTYFRQPQGALLGFKTRVINPPVSSGGVNYLTDVAPLIETHCLSCHSKGGEKADVNLAYYESVISNRYELIARVMENSMPPTGPLSPGEKEILREWSRQGFPEY